MCNKPERLGSRVLLFQQPSGMFWIAGPVGRCHGRVDPAAEPLGRLLSPSMTMPAGAVGWLALTPRGESGAVRVAPAGYADESQLETGKFSRECVPSP